MTTCLEVVGPFLPSSGMPFSYKRNVVPLRLKADAQATSFETEPFLYEQACIG